MVGKTSGSLGLDKVDGGRFGYMTPYLQLRKRNAFCSWFSVRFTAPALAKAEEAAAEEAPKAKRRGKAAEASVVVHKAGGLMAMRAKRSAAE